MKVYIVREYWDYEGSRILGVFFTEAEAQFLVDCKRAGDYGFDRYDWAEFTVGEVLYGV